jgi:branched-chain amino acid transport system substrate-binding protein
MKKQFHTFELRRALAILLAVGSGSVRAHASFRDPEPPLLTQKVRVGLLAPLSGVASAGGEVMVRGAILAAEQINAQGGIYLKEHAGRMLLDLVVADTQTSPEGGAAAATKLVTEDRVDVVTGGYSSAVAVAAQRVIAEHGTPFLICGVGTSQVTRRTDIDTSWMFHYNEIGAYHGKAMAAFLAEVVHPRVAPDRPLRVALIYQEGALGDDYREGLPGLGIVGWTRASQLPLEFVAQEKFPLGETDFRPQLSAIQAARPDVIVPLGLGGETVAILRQGIRDLGIKALWGPTNLSVDTPADHQALGEIDPFTTIETLFSTYDTPRGAVGALAAQFRAAFQKRWGEPPGARAASAYDALFILKRALEDAGGLDRTRLRDALTQLDMPALTQPVEGGRIRFDENREVRFTLFVTQLYQDSASGQTRSRIVWPREFANAEFRLP